MKAMSPAPALSFDRWSDLSARSKGLSEEELMDLLEAEDVTFDGYLQAGPIHLLAIVEGLNAGDSTLADAHVRRGSQGQIEDAQTARAAALPPAASPAPLPFSGSPSPEFQRSLAQARVAPEAIQSGETLMAGHAPSDQTLPFQATGVIPTVDQYAELCARIAHEPSKAMVIRAQHQLQDQQRFEALERLFRKKFELDPLLEGRFKQALATKLQALRAGR